ncbi:peptidase domain-containing ABC transporter RaxB [Xanthomonas graminis]|jgi:ATP-binding cassette subfamily B protein RaxB|uniref:ABC transporter protein RaxB n=1 Tax=Xanthomonas graminis pv. graminis TaxID=134874 RepID=A0A1M4L615_9XANT|nr:peptidase domain-containing ABC transporter RaxB [Xanthomonas translucens]EKU23867.1 ABC transporter permease and ATP-binding protein RaxB [Xanthomonas translucens pv. graminis ART-Xtg29]OAX58274.1 ABC transporter ATP-binding protein [Xanthomonas translucens pv. graminis]UKE55385.1 peptidase domain-containing ABC transporter RaxB [Xanthomonas translucens pv. graminis]WIH09760.1 peptidase domain-containing ABC transporter RaxB [Xanthomonas translucens pv. graminis]WIH11507.1 peptidase domain
MSVWLQQLRRLAGARRMPIVLQGQVGECGLAAMAMVAHYHGCRVGLAALRRRFLLSRQGTTLASLVSIAQAIGLQPRAVRLEMDALDDLQLPCILHWDLNHFVVLKRVGARHIEINDPANGPRRLHRTEFAKHFTGIALELAPAADFRPQPAPPPLALSSLIGRVHGLKRAVWQIVALALALELVSLGMPFQLQWIVDQALPSADIGLIDALGIGFLLLVLLQAAIGLLRGWLITTFSAQLAFQWMGQVFAHLLALPLAYFEKRHLGGIQSRFDSILQIQRTLTTGFMQTMVDGVLVIGTLCLMLAYSPSLSAITLLAVAAYAGMRALWLGRLRDAAAEELLWNARQHTHFLESVRGVQGIRLFGRQHQRRMDWTHLLAEQTNAHLRLNRGEVSLASMKLLLFGAERVLVVWLAAFVVLRNQLSLGMLLAFLAYREQFALRLSGLIDRLAEFRLLRIHLERVADIVHHPREHAGEQADPGRWHDTGIELRGLGFRYADDAAPVLDQVNLQIRAGECVAITGVSGCGKTTLVKLILGLLEPTEGEIRIGGRPLTGALLAQYRANVGTVMQDDMLFTGSVADNITFFDPEPDHERMRDCARMAAVHEDVERMPLGYDSALSEAGAGLSGGQRQRLLLARALYKSPRILVLDEATSHLDVMNESRVNAAIQALQLTRIIVAHRRETLRMAARVITLAHGRVVGDHPIEDWLRLTAQAPVEDGLAS